MSNPRTPEDYQLAIDRVYDRLEQMRPRPKDTVSVKTENFLVNTLPKVVSFGAFGVGAAAMTASIALAVSIGDSIEGTSQAAFAGKAAFASFITAIPMVASGIAVIEAGGQKIEKVLTPVLGLVGKALPVNESHVKNMVDWSHDYPRIAPVLGRWAAEHPSNILTVADYNRMARAVKKLRVLTTRQKEAQQRIQSQQCLQGSDIGAAARKYKLTQVSQKFRPTDGESDTPAQATPPQAKPKM